MCLDVSAGLNMFKKSPPDESVEDLLNQAQQRQDEERLLEQVVGELERGFRKDGVWAKALIFADGDEDRAKANYLKLRVQSLKDEALLNAVGSAYHEQKREAEAAEKFKAKYSSVFWKLKAKFTFDSDEAIWKAFKGSVVFPIGSTSIMEKLIPHLKAIAEGDGELDIDGGKWIVREPYPGVRRSFKTTQELYDYLTGK